MEELLKKFNPEAEEEELAVSFKRSEDEVKKAKEAKKELLKPVPAKPLPPPKLEENLAKPVTSGSNTQEVKAQKVKPSAPEDPKDLKLKVR